jgi:1,4-dihydroxy-2-naphthoyl-CoA hydrolase
MSPESVTAEGDGHLPGLIGVQFTAIEPDTIRARLAVRPELLAPNGFLHAATVIALADTACGYGALAFRAQGATGFTTIELKCNYLGTIRDGAIAVLARKAHGGRSTQVWDAEVTNEADGKVIALFRCTQMMLYPR